MDKAKFDIGILVPLKEEFRYVAEIAPQIASILHDGTHFYRLNFGTTSAVCCLIDQMGPLAALHATFRLLAFADVKLLVLLGTAGTLDDDVAIGDVVIASEVNEFQANSKAEPAGDTYEVRYSGRHWPLEFGIREAITHFEFSGRDAFGNWQTTASNDYNEITLEDKTSVCSSPPRLHLGAIASGNVVAASKAFKAEVKRINRKFLAIDMEAAGIASAALDRIHPLSYIIIRGISDPSDEDKKVLDRGSKNAWRRYCVRNASSLLRNLLSWDGFLNAAGLRTPSTIPTENDTARELTRLLESCIGGPWAIGVAFGIYSHGPRVLDSGIVVPADLNSLRVSDARVRDLMDTLNEERGKLDSCRDIQVTANEIRQIVDEFRTRLGSTDVNKLLRDFDKVVVTILCPEDADEEIQSLLLEADRLEDNVGAEAVVDLLKGIAGKHQRLRERYIDALARAGMWLEIANSVSPVDITQLSRSELEHGIFACSKIGMRERVNDMLRRHQNDYADNAAKLFREEMHRQGVDLGKPTRDIET